MRKPYAAALAARKASPAKIGLLEAPAYWVCLALMLALVVLARAIAGML
jgi:hypothetical protein